MNVTKYIVTHFAVSRHHQGAYLLSCSILVVFGLSVTRMSACKCLHKCSCALKLYTLRSSSHMAIATV